MNEDNSNICKACIDVELPIEQVEAAARAAIKENPANLGLLPPQNFQAVDVGVLPPARMALLAGKRWAPGRTLRVAFMHGDPYVISKVIQFASEWMNYANIRFEFVNQWPADIRIAFLPGGSYSYIGTDNLQIPGNQHTMNFGWFTPQTSDDEFRRTTVHEFGHALGCIHEHQHPQSPILWNKPVVYEYYARMGWPPQQVDQNVFYRYSAQVTNHSAFDRDSIMLYPVPKEHTVDGFTVGWNSQLSAMDKQFIGAIYPRLFASARAVDGIRAESADFKGEIGKAGEEDHYEITVSEKSAYEIETEGNADVVVALMKKGDFHIIAQDDNSGKGKNARIRTMLEPGSYLLRVKHFHPSGTGSYRVKSKKVELAGVK